MNIKTLNIKIGKMRKPDSCVVYSTTNDDPNYRLVQGSRLIMRVNITTNIAIANYNTGSAYPSSHHLPYGFPLKLDQQLVDSIVDATPKTGDTMGNGVVVLA